MPPTISCMRETMFLQCSPHPLAIADRCGSEFDSDSGQEFGSGSKRFQFRLVGTSDRKERPGWLCSTVGPSVRPRSSCYPREGSGTWAVSGAAGLPPGRSPGLAHLYVWFCEFLCSNPSFPLTLVPLIFCYCSPSSTDSPPQP